MHFFNSFPSSVTILVFIVSLSSSQVVFNSQFRYRLLNIIVFIQTAYSKSIQYTTVFKINLNKAQYNFFV